jgi:hypothetical protein
MAEPSTRAKWRALRSARVSTPKKYLTGTTLSEKRCFNSNTHRQQEKTLVQGRIGTMSKRLWRLLAVLLSMNICAVNEHEGFCPPAPPNLVAAKRNLENFKLAILEPTTLWSVEQLHFHQESGAPARTGR